MDCWQVSLKYLWCGTSNWEDEQRIIVKSIRAASERLECWAQELELDAVGDLRATGGFYPTRNIGSDASGEAAQGTV